MTSTTETVQRADGAPELLVRHWAAAGRAWAAMLIVHGLAEHSGRYERTGAGFAAVGIDVTAIDLRGNGGSGGRRAYVERWSDYLDDVEWRLGRGPRRRRRHPGRAARPLARRARRPRLRDERASGAGPARALLARARLDAPGLEEGPGQGAVRQSPRR